MPTLFYLWKLPASARINAIRQLNPVHVIFLSLSTKSLKRFLKAYKLQCHELTWSLYNVYKKDTPNMIRIRLNFSNVGLIVDFDFSTLPVLLSDAFKIGGFIGNRYFNTFSIGNPDGTPSGIGGVGEVSRFLLEICYVRKFNLDQKSSLKNFDIFDSFLFDCTKRFSNMTILTRGYEKYSKNNILYLLNHIKVEDRLSLSIELDEPILDPFSISTTRFSILPCDWFPVDNLLNSENRRIDIDLLTPITSQDVVRLITTWQEGVKLRKLSSMVLRLFLGIPWMETMKMINELEGVEAETPQDVEDNKRHVRRRTDGRKASFKVEPFQIKFDVKY